jgi:hypothetical protein
MDSRVHSEKYFLISNIFSSNEEILFRTKGSLCNVMEMFWMLFLSISWRDDLNAAFLPWIGGLKNPP